jgi:hypothetical protein
LSKLKWFTYNQNNSGGSFVVNKNVAHFVLIQAKSAEYADAVGRLFFDNSNSCPCCGERWGGAECDQGSVKPKIYGTPVEKYKNTYLKDGQARLHYANGNIESIVFGDQEQPK